MAFQLPDAVDSLRRHNAFCTASCLYSICQLGMRSHPSAVQNMTSDVSGLKEEVAEMEVLRAEVQGMQQALQAALQRKQSADWFLQ